MAASSLHSGTRITTSLVLRHCTSRGERHAGGGDPAPGAHPKGSEVRTVIRHVSKRLRRHWPKTRIVWRGDSHYGRVEAMEWADMQNGWIPRIQ
jgi:Transposase DDE domain group 1